jgi:hypothetical protein
MYGPVPGVAAIFLPSRAALVARWIARIDG